MRISPLVALSVLLVSTPSIRLAAQPAPAPAAAAAQVEVSSVKFGGARYNGESWLEADVELEARPNGKAVSGEYVNRVRVTLTFLVEASDTKGAKKSVFYRGGAELVALEGGKSNVRFYLPPEIVKRDKLRPDVDYYAAEVEVGGEVQAPVKSSASAKFTSAESMKNFLSKAAAESAANEGLLMPQYLTPFANDTQRRSPTFVRREAQR